MSDVSSAHRRSPFEGHIPADRPTRDGQIGVRLTVDMLHSVIQLGTWPMGVEAWTAALAPVFGQALPAQTGDTCQMPAGLVMRVGPEELLVVSDDSSPPSHERVAALRRQLPANIGSVLDLSHARCRVRIEGEHAVDMLGKLYALDFREHAFPVGRVQLSGHHHVPCALHRTGPAGFDAYVFTTYARDQLETFADAALEYGVVVLAGRAIIA